MGGGGKPDGAGTKTWVGKTTARKNIRPLSTAASSSVYESTSVGRDGEGGGGGEG